MAAFNMWKGSYKGKILQHLLKRKNMPRDKLPKENCWDGYSAGRGMTICAEGGGSTGSHGKLHNITARALKYAIGRSRDLNYTAARNRVAGIVARQFGCNKNCIIAQLDQAYSQMYKCKNFPQDARVVPHAGRSGDGNRAIGKPRGVFS